MLGPCVRWMSISTRIRTACLYLMTRSRRRDADPFSVSFALGRDPLERVGDHLDGHEEPPAEIHPTEDRTDQQPEEDLPGDDERIGEDEYVTDTEADDYRTR